ncbi:ATP-dependent RNA helicase DDX4-like isoform X3 [Crassostrea angulata]|uniref:ATP-dependent RNA helicase DDX4-like isoform X3 n=1 Tax=Magallana angulata TaxID=2784310 RepID=UPI0022B0D45C|nr:ATP-dependent RNA helicase DDX4-like isoform X3 [Crassostrea angulata]
MTGRGRGILGNKNGFGRGGFGRGASSSSDASGGAGRGFGRGVLRTGFTVNGNDDVSNGMADMSLNKPGGMANGFGKSDNNSSSGGFGSKGGFGGGSSGGGFGGGSGGFGNKSDSNNNNGSRGGFGGGSSGGGFGGGSSGGGFGAKKEGGFGGGGFGSKNDGESSGFGGGFGGGDRPPRGGGFGGGGGSGCRNCGEEGHFARECPEPRKGGGGGGDRGCRNCGEEGHFARECPNPKKEGGGGGGGKCFKCQEEGHMARDCPNAPPQDPDRPAPYVPPAPSEDEAEIFKVIQKGINFDSYDKIPVEVTGRDPPSSIKNFDEAGLYEKFLENVRKAQYEKPTPVQKYSIPIVMAGRDLMACAQTGSGKTAAFLLPVLTGMMKNGISGSSFSEVQEPQALVVAPTRELAVQIFMDARKFAHGTMLRAVVLYGGTSVGYQLRQVEQGTHILVGTPGRLIDIIGKGKISLSKLKYLILDEADRMLDMGFGPDIRKLVEELGTPPKTERQTLMFSATFPEEIQKMAGDFLNDYLFLTVGRVGGACTDVTQTVYEVDRQEKRSRLCDILTETGSEKTLVFVEQKRNADFLASYLSQNGFPTTSIHGDRLQAEREEALRDFKLGKAPVLIATSVAARGLDIPLVKHVINYDLPQSIDEYVHRIGRTGRCGNLGKAISFYSNDTDGALAKPLVRILSDAMQEVPSWLEEYSKSSMPGAGYADVGAKFGGRDIRKNQPRTRETHKGEGGYPLGAGGSVMVGSGGAQEEDEENWD